MNKTIIEILALCMAIVLLVFLGFAIVKAEKVLPVIDKSTQLELKNKLLEAQNIELQLQPVMQRRKQLLDDINQMINHLYASNDLDKLEYGLNLETMTFYILSEEEKEAMKKQQEKTNE